MGNGGHFGACLIMKVKIVTRGKTGANGLVMERLLGYCLAMERLLQHGNCLGVARLWRGCFNIA